MQMKKFMHDNKPALCLVAIIFGLPALVISILSLLYGEGDTGLILWAHESLGSWGFWLAILGGALSVAGVYYLYDFIKMLREFKNLVKTDSKAKFIKNIDRIEELAWRLHPKYERIVIQKKKKFRVR